MNKPQTACGANGGLVRPTIIITVIDDAEGITKMWPYVIICHLMFMFIFETKAKIYTSKGTLWEYKYKEKTKT